MDYGHKWTDDELKKLEKRIAKEYSQASKEVEKKLSTFMANFATKDKAKLQQLSAGEITQAEYNHWRLGQVMMGKRWTEMRDTLAEDLTKTMQKTDSMTRQFSYDAYALNHNYGTFEVEKGSLLDTSYTLYDRSTVERLVRDDPDLLPPPGKKVSQAIREGKAERWNKQKIQSVMTQSLLQGEPMEKIARRLADAVSDSDMKAAIRNARTMTTGAENAGRVDSYKRAQDMGIVMRQMWESTLDDLTRPEHRQLDGQVAMVGDPFEVDGYEIRFPGDPLAEPEMVYNCRCTLIAVVDGTNIEETREDIREDASIDGQSYEEWKNGHKEGQAEEKEPAVDREKIIADIKDKILNKTYGDDIPQSFKDKLFKSIDHADDKMLGIIDKTADKLELVWHNEGGTSCHMNNSTTVHIYAQKFGDYRGDDDLIRTFWHEFGHMVDDAEYSGSGYGWEEALSSIGKTHFRFGITEEALKDNLFEQASVDDINLFFSKTGLSEKYIAKLNDSGMAWIYKVSDGEICDPLFPDYEWQHELSTALSDWTKERTGRSIADNFLYDMGFPRDADFEKYYETYITPKRRQVKTRERYKGASKDYTDELTRISKQKDEFWETHDRDAIFAEQDRLYKIAEANESKMGWITDTFDGAGKGCFSSVIIGGHDAEYYLSRNNYIKEPVANVFSTETTGDTFMSESMAELCPNVFSLIKGIIRK